ncbi:MAG: hypothetical protein WBV94_29605 [Blastocatellia bacterium]
MRNDQFTQSRDAHFVYIVCRCCGSEAVFNASCCTSQLEQQRQASIEQHKRKHVCTMRVAA